MEVKILGTGCPKCKALAEKVQFIAQENGLPIKLEKVTDLTEIMNYGVMMTPAIVVSGEVKAAGKIPKDDDILKWLK